MPANYRLTYWMTSTNLTAWQFGGWTTNNFVVIARTNSSEFFQFVPVTNTHFLRVGANQPQPPVFF